MVQLLTGRKVPNIDSRAQAAPVPTTPTYIQTAPIAKTAAVRNTSPSTRSITPERRLSSSSTPRRTLHSSVTKQLFTTDQRKQYREEMDRYIKASVTTLGSALAQDCLETMQRALAEELKQAEDRLRADLEGNFHQSSRDLFRRLKEFVARLTDIPSGKATSAEEDEAVFKGKRRAIKYSSPEANVKVYDELVRAPPERELSLRLSKDPRQTQAELQEFVDRGVEDLGNRLQDICRQTALREVKAKVAKVQELLAAEVEESVEDMRRTVQRRLEAFAQGRARESTSGRKQTMRTSGSSTVLQDSGKRREETAGGQEEEELAREYLRIPKRESSDPSSLLTPSSSAASMEVPRHPPKPATGKARPGSHSVA